jgi:hypothetical protein
MGLRTQVSPAEQWHALHVGFMSQTPLGDECVAVFDRIKLRHETLRDLRDGS